MPDGGGVVGRVLAAACYSRDKWIESFLPYFYFKVLCTRLTERRMRSNKAQNTDGDRERKCGIM